MVAGLLRPVTVHDTRQDPGKDSLEHDTEFGASDRFRIHCSGHQERRYLTCLETVRKTLNIKFRKF